MPRRPSVSCLLATTWRLHTLRFFGDSGVIQLTGWLASISSIYIVAALGLFPGSFLILQRSPSGAPVAPPGDVHGVAAPPASAFTKPDRNGPAAACVIAASNQASAWPAQYYPQTRSRRLSPKPTRRSPQRHHHIHRSACFCPRARCPGGASRREGRQRASAAEVDTRGVCSATRARRNPAAGLGIGGDRAIRACAITNNSPH